MINGIISPGAVRPWLPRHPTADGFESKSRRLISFRMGIVPAEEETIKPVGTLKDPARDSFPLVFWLVKEPPYDLGCLSVNQSMRRRAAHEQASIDNRMAP